MKIEICSRLCRFLAVLIGLLAITGKMQGAELDVIVSQAKRQAVLDQGKSLLAAKETSIVLKDPFHSEAYSDSIAGGTRGSDSTRSSNPVENVVTRPVTAGPRTPAELLQAIATSPSLKPSGYFVLGGQPTLVFGQKRVKAGGFLTITFEGAEYALEILSIDRPNFTLRLNREEFTRPIK